MNVCEKCKNYTKMGYKGREINDCIFKAFRRIMENQGKDFKKEFKDLCPYYLERIVIDGVDEDEIIKLKGD